MNLTIHKLPLGRDSYIDFDKSIFMKMICHVLYHIARFCC